MSIYQDIAETGRNRRQERRERFGEWSSEVAKNVSKIINPLGWEQWEEEQKRYVTQMGREDTAVSRLAADLSAAGLSKQFAVGGAKGAASARPGAPIGRKGALERSMELANLAQQSVTVGRTFAEMMLLREQANTERFKTRKTAQDVENVMLENKYLRETFGYRTGILEQKYLTDKQKKDMQIWRTQMTYREYQWQTAYIEYLEKEKVKGNISWDVNPLMLEYESLRFAKNYKERETYLWDNLEQIAGDPAVGRNWKMLLSLIGAIR